MRKKDLDYWLEEIAVLAPGMWYNNTFDTIGDWYAVSDTIGIIAYFEKEVDAYRFRLDYINRKLNP